MSRIASLAKWGLSVIVAGAFLAPLLWMVLASFHTEATVFQTDWRTWWAPGDWTLANYCGAWHRAALGQALAVSLVQVLAIAGAGLIVNALAAFAFARLIFPGRDLVFAVVVMLIILPLEAIAVPLFFTARDLGMTGGLGPAMAGLVVPFIANAFNIYFLRQHFLSLPVQLEEAAVLDGAGVATIFWRIALPAIKPALATVVLLDLLTHWGDFLWPLMISTRADTRTVQISLASLFTQPPVQWGQILACSVLATLPVVALFHWCQRLIVATETQVGIK